MRSRVLVGVVLLLTLALGVAAVARAQEGVTVNLIVRVRDMQGQPIVGIGVHVYATDEESPRLVGEQLTDAGGGAQFALVGGNRSYSVALYAPAGFSLAVVSEDQQYLAGMGDLGVETGIIGIGVVLGEHDYTLRLALKDGQPYYDTAPDSEPPDPFIPGVSDAGWPTPTPFALAVTTGTSPTPEPQPTPLTSPSAGAGVNTTGEMKPTPFPWLAVLVMGTILAGIYGLYTIYSRGGFRRSRWTALWTALGRRLRRPRSGENSGQREEDR